MKKTIIKLLIILMVLVVGILSINNLISANTNTLTEITERIKMVNGYIILINEEAEKVGQMWADKSTLLIYGYVGRSIEIGAGNNVILNAGGGSVEIRQGNKTKIKISEDRIDINTNNLYINGKKYE